MTAKKVVKPVVKTPEPIMNVVKPVEVKPIVVVPEVSKKPVKKASFELEGPDLITFGKICDIARAGFPESDIIILVDKLKKLVL